MCKTIEVHQTKHSIHFENRPKMAEKSKKSRFGGRKVLRSAWKKNLVPSKISILGQKKIFFFEIFEGAKIFFQADLSTFRPLSRDFLDFWAVFWVIFFKSRIQKPNIIYMHNTKVVFFVFCLVFFFNCKSTRIYFCHYAILGMELRRFCPITSGYTFFKKPIFGRPG